MNFIQNVGAGDIPKGNHFDCGDNAMLIQISDPFAPETEQHSATRPWFPIPKHSFKETHQFQFLDIEDNDKLVDTCGITDDHAKELVRLLQHALDNRMNVVIHCLAGVCRSGAVAEVGIMMGFIDAKAFRIPNTRVKTKMMKALGWSYEI